MKKSLYLGCILLFTGFIVNAQLLTKKKILNASKEKFVDATNTLVEFLKIPNDGNFEDQVERNLQWCSQTFNSLDFETKIIATDGAPLLFAEKKYHKNAKTVLFYLQIDGQPVDSSKWDQKDPFNPVLKKQIDANTWEEIDLNLLKVNADPDWRIFARSASDSKGPAIAFISALEIFQKKGWKPAYNIKVILDFQEELGSPHLAKAVSKNKGLLKSDMLFIMDGTRHVSNLPTLTYGARGIATASITFFGPRYPLHSGQYGNFAPNPVFNASKFIGQLKDESGRVLIPGFYDGIQLSDTEKEIINSLPEDVDEIKKRIGVAAIDAVGTTYQESLQYPSLNIRGLRAAWVGKEVRTIIPSEVIAEIDMRLVPESDGKRQMELLKNYLQEKGYHLVDSIPSDQERSSFKKLASFKYRLGSVHFEQILMRLSD